MIDLRYFVEIEVALQDLTSHGHHGCLTAHIRYVCTGVTLGEVNQLAEVDFSVDLNAFEVDIEKLAPAALTGQGDVYALFKAASESLIKVLRSIGCSQNNDILDSFSFSLVFIG